MRKLLAAFVVVASIGLGGCETLSAITGIPSSVLTGTFQNPITPNALADIERAYQGALGIANVYVELCRTRQIPRASCRPVVERIQSYVNLAHQALMQLRGFVANNDTINAASALSAFRAAMAAFQNSVDYQTVTAATGAR